MESSSTNGISARPEQPDMFQSPSLSCPISNSQAALTTREERILDWHFLRMKAWGVVVPAIFLASFKPVLTPKSQEMNIGASAATRFGLADVPTGVLLHVHDMARGSCHVGVFSPSRIGKANRQTTVVWTRTWVQNMTNRAAAVEYLKEDGGPLGMLGIPKRDRLADVPLKPQGRRFE